MLATHAAGSATTPLIASCSFVFRVFGFIIGDLKKKLWKAVSLDHEGNPDISMSCILLQTIQKGSGFTDLQKVIQQGSSRP